MQSKLKIYNSLSREKEVFEPINPPFVGLYVCGPTVYNEAHTGNLRTFISFDVVYRYLVYLGFKVRYVRNITDVGHITNDAGEDIDRIGEQAAKEQLQPMEIVKKYTDGFHRVMDVFNLIQPSIEPTATGHIIEQIEMVQEILDNGYAYEVNGSVYFDLKKYLEDHDYGKLSGRKVDELYEQTRELEGGSEKRFFADFAIWKHADESFPMRWNSPWGMGVPGWHLECSVMSTKYLGQQFDIHGGGMDLKFPHHECEIAQNVGSRGTEPVKYWMHGNMLTFEGQKMSKSLGNAVLPFELTTGQHALLEKAYSPMTIRFFMLQSHYRSTLDFSNTALQAAEKGFERLMNSVGNLNKLVFKEGETDQNEIDYVKSSIQSVSERMDDDFNTAEAIAKLFDLSKRINTYTDNPTETGKLDKATFEQLKEFYPSFIEEVLGLKQEESADSNLMDGVMNLLIEIRHDARANKDFNTSDKIRDKLSELKIELLDSREGTDWKKK